jgi:phosphinothricin acetyltransferase
MITIRPLLYKDWIAVSEIYSRGIATKMATFETDVPEWEEWDEKYIDCCRIVAEINDLVVGFGVLSPVSQREVYKGVAEVSVYVDEQFKRKGIGRSLLEELIVQSEKNGFWSLQAGIFSENVASIELHKKCGFRVVGVKEKIGRLDGKWYDNHFLERRSKIIGT